MICQHFLLLSSAEIVEADDNEGMDMSEGIHGDDGTSAIIAGVNDDDDFPNVTANIQVRIEPMHLGQ